MKSQSAWVIYLVLVLECKVDAYINGQPTVADLPDYYDNNFFGKLSGTVPKFSYSLDPVQPLNELTQTDLITCGQVLQQGYVNFQQSKADPRPYYALNQVPLTPKTQNTPSINSLPKCNPFTDSSCEACALLPVGYEAIVKIYDSFQTDAVATFRCFHFAQKDCGVRKCNQGEYATDYVSLNENGYVTSKTSCLPCAPGTWLTCIDDNACVYNIPLSPGTFDSGGKIYKPNGQDPVGRCFSCPSAGNGKVHYGQTARKTIIELAASDPLKWYCPGKDSPPILCPAPYAGADKNFSSCVCGPGNYPSGSGTSCVPCPVGGMCPEGTYMECPDGTYQNNAGATMCNPCLTEDGLSNSCETRTPPKKMRKCVGAYKKEIPVCVPCNMCVRPYVDLPAGTVDCY